MSMAFFVCAAFGAAVKEGLCPARDARSPEYFCQEEGAGCE